MYDDEDDVEEADEVLEITIPATMANLLDFTQHAYYSMQKYLFAQWTLMQGKLAEDEVDGDNMTFDYLFQSIIKHNNLEELGGTDEEGS